MLKPHVAVCIPTFKRPGFLGDLLHTIHGADKSSFQVTVIVADNDSSGSAEAIVSDFRDVSSLQTVYCIESSRGLASVRNRLVSEAKAIEAEYLVFVDDDQLVTQGWLTALVSVAETTTSDAVIGRWIPHYESGVPDWVRRSKYWRRSWGATGTRAVHFGTGNTLLRISSLEAFSKPFDERMNHMGGEDSLFFAQFRSRGLKAVWAYDSLVLERIPPSRATAQWMIRRSYRTGLVQGVTIRWTRTETLDVVRRLLKSSALIGINFALIIPATIHGRAGTVPRLANVARGIGGIIGVLGVSSEYREYLETPHGA